MSEFLKDCLFQWLQRLLFILVAREDGKRQRDAIAIDEHSHLHNGIGAACFALSVFFASLFPLNLKAIVCAVIIKNPIVSVYLEAAVFIGFRLYEFTFPGKHAQGPVNIMFLIGWLFEKIHCRLVGCPLAARLQYSGIYQI